MTNPLFPNRPKHKDFQRMVEAVNRLDMGSDAGLSFNTIVGSIDLDSLAYMAEQRALRAAMILAEPVSRERQAGAAWLDGFMAGVVFQQLGGHEE